MKVYALGSDGANGTNVGIFTSEADLYRALADDICSPSELEKAQAMIDAGEIETAKEYLTGEVSPPDLYTYSIDEIDLLSNLTLADLVQLLVAIKDKVYPEAVISVEGELICCSCKERTTPLLREDGYMVTHELKTITDTTIEATGFDGGSENLTEDGDMLLLECQHCFELHRIPDSVTVDWQ